VCVCTCVLWSHITGKRNVSIEVQQQCYVNILALSLMFQHWTVINTATTTTTTTTTNARAHPCTPMLTHSRARAPTCSHTREHECMPLSFTRALYTKRCSYWVYQVSLVKHVSWPPKTIHKSPAAIPATRPKTRVYHF